MSIKAQGVIAESFQDGYPIIWKFVNKLPDIGVRSKLPHLVVILWEYDKELNNGMPVSDENTRMIRLEESLEDKLEEADFCRHVSSSTGNGRKELCYYVADTTVFMGFLNEALVGQKRYPINIKLYEDLKWDDFQRTLNMIK